MTPALDVSEAKFVREYFASVEPIYIQADLGHSNFVLCLDGSVKFMPLAPTAFGGPYTWSVLNVQATRGYVFTDAADVHANRHMMIGKRVSLLCHDRGSEQKDFSLAFSAYGTVISCYENLVNNQISPPAHAP